MSATGSPWVNRPSRAWTLIRVPRITGSPPRIAGSSTISACGLEDIGASVVGPAARVGDALALLDSEPVDGAILDVSLDNEKVFSVAEALTARGIPFIFATGYSASDLPPAWRHVPRYEKPLDAVTVARALFGDDAP